MPECKRVVLSGGPGTGKTSLIAELESQGYACFHEFSRVIIKESLKKGSNVLPWKDLEAFTEKVLEGRISQFNEAPEGISFYDRSLVDSIAYMHKDKLEPKQEWKSYLNTYKYHEVVFITPPWKEIFENDNERRESWEQLLHIHEYLVSTYQDQGYKVVTLPNKSIKERVSFLLKNLP